MSLLAAAQVLSEACQVVLDETRDPVTLRERIYARVPAEHLQAAVTTVGELTRPPDDTYAQELLGRYVMMRRFLPTFWRTLEFESTPGGRPTLHAVQFLQRIEGRPRASMQAARRDPALLAALCAAPRHLSARGATHPTRESRGLHGVRRRTAPRDIASS